MSAERERLLGEELRDIATNNSSWRLFTIEGRTYRARIKAVADPALWPAAQVEAEHLTPNGFRETRRPDTLAALYRLLVSGEPEAGD